MDKNTGKTIEEEKKKNHTDTSISALGRSSPNVEEEKLIKYNDSTVSKEKIFEDVLLAYSINSLFIFSKNNKLRLLFIKINENKYFERIMLVIIVLNSILMFLYNYSINICNNMTINREECLIKYEKDIEMDKLLDKINIIFLIIYLVEFVIKVIAMGFLFEKATYLRDPSHSLDFLINLFALLNYFYKDVFFRTFSLKLFRLLIPFRTFKNEYLEPIRIHVHTLLNSILMLSNVFLFLFVILSLFSVLGLQVFSGTIYNRCREKPYFNETLSRYIAPINFGINSLCSLDNSSFICPKDLFCVNFYDIPKYFNMSAEITIDNFSVADEKVNTSKFINYGVSNFDYISYSTLNVFSTVRFQNWVKLVELYRNVDLSSTKIFFVSIVVIGGFFVIKIILATQNECLNSAKGTEEDLIINIIKQNEENNNEIIGSVSTIESDHKSINKLIKSKSLHSTPLVASFKNPDKKLKVSGYFESEFAGFYDLLKRSNLSSNGQNNNPNIVFSDYRNLNLPSENVKDDNSYYRYKESKIDKSSSELERLNQYEKTNDSGTIGKIYDEIKQYCKIIIVGNGEGSNFPSIIFYSVIYCSLLVNIISLALNNFPNYNEEKIKTIDTINLVCTGIYFLEMFFKFFALGFKDYFKDKYNIIDIFVLITSSLEILYIKIFTADIYSSSFSSFRAVRFLRIIKMAKKDTVVGEAFNFLLFCFKELFYYLILLLFFQVVFLLIGRELFANKVKLIETRDEYNYEYDQIISPRENFDTLFNSFMTVFILFIGDKWPSIMYEYAKYDDFKLSSIFYFLSVILIGNILLYNLFLAILMSNFDDIKDKNNDIHAIADHEKTLKTTIKNLQKMTSKGIKNVKKHLSSIMKKLVLEDTSDIDERIIEKIKKNMKNRRNAIISTSNGGIIASQIKKAINDNYKPIVDKSLYLFDANNPIRLFCWDIILNHSWFEYTMRVIIILSMVNLIIERPYIQDRNMLIALFYYDIVINFIFSIEALCKIIAFGFIKNGEHSYLRDKNSILEFVCLVFSIVYIIFSGATIYTDDKNDPTIKLTFQFLKVIRIIRAFRLVGLSQTLQMSLNGLYKSLFQIVVLIILALGVIMMFAIVGLNYFKGFFYRCNFTYIPLFLHRRVKTKWDCLDYGGEWQKIDPNYDNIWESILVFFQMMTGDNWTKFLFLSLDSSLINYQPSINQSPHWFFFYYIYIVLSFFFLLNLCISVLSENYKKEKNASNRLVFKTDVQREFYDIFRHLYSVKVPKKNEKMVKLQKILLSVIDSVYFEVLITMCIIGNIIMLIMTWPGQSSVSKLYIEQINSILSYIFLFEAVLKIYVFRLSYFTIIWNITDFIIVFSQTANLIFNVLIGSSPFFNTTLLRLLRVLRILRMLKQARVFNRIFNLFLNSISGVLNISLIYFLFVFIYAVIGMNVFSLVKHQTHINETWNFENFFNSVLVLLRITSGDNWSGIMYEYAKIKSNDFECKYISEMGDNDRQTGNLFIKLVGCGNPFSYFYFISFVILGNMIFLQFFNVIISITASDTVFLNFESLTLKEITKFKEKWVYYDREGKGYINIEELHPFLSSLGFPLGIRTKKVKNFLRYVAPLEIFTYERKYVFFYDVLTELAKNYIIHKSVEIDCVEKWGDDMYFEEKKCLEKKILEYSVMARDINEMKKSSVVQKLNPYYNEDNYYACFKDRMNETLQSYFGGREFINVNISWAVTRLSKMIRCYKFMKKRTINLIESNKYQRANIQVTIKYLARVKLYQKKKSAQEVKNDVNLKEISNKGYRRIRGNKAFQEKRTSIFSHIYSELETQINNLEFMKKSIDSSESEDKMKGKDSKELLELKQDLEKSSTEKKQGTPRFSTIVIE